MTTREEILAALEDARKTLGEARNLALGHNDVYAASYYQQVIDRTALAEALSPPRELREALTANNAGRLKLLEAEREILALKRELREARGGFGPLVPQQ